MEYSQAEILQTVAMTEMEHLDVRTVTLGLSLRDCATGSVEELPQKRARKFVASPNVLSRLWMRSAMRSVFR